MNMNNKGYKEIKVVEGKRVEGRVLAKVLVSGERAVMLKMIFKSGSIVPLHKHDFEAMGYVLKGKLKLVVGGKELVVGGGDVWHHPRSIKHSTEAVEDSEWIEIRMSK